MPIDDAEKLVSVPTVKLCGHMSLSCTTEDSLKLQGKVVREHFDRYKALVKAVREGSSDL